MSTNGNDLIFGTIGVDVIDGGNGNDTIWGFPNDDTLLGGNGNDEIRGNRGNDVIDGGNGSDLIIGGRGEDTMTGGTGADTFSWLKAAHGADNLADSDLITDFAEIDTIDLRGLHITSPLEFEVAGDITVVRGSTDADAAAEFVLRVDFNGPGSLDASDFIL